MSGPRPQPSILNWWVIWLALMAGLPMFYIFLAPSTPTPPGSGGPAGGLDPNLWFVGVLPMVISSVLRWAVLPRLTTIQTAQPVFIAGIALAETCCFLGLFIFPNAKNELFAAAAVGMLQYAPFFAARFYR